MTDEDEINAMLASVIPINTPPVRKKRPKNSLWVVGDETEIADRMLTQLSQESTAPIMAHSQTLWVCGKDSLWRPVDKGEWVRRVCKFGGQPVGQDGKPLRLNDKTYKGSWSIALDLVKPIPHRPPVGVAAKNGFLAIEHGRVIMRPLKPEDAQTEQWGVSYVESDDAPTWDKCCQMWWPESWREKQAFLQAFFGLAYLGAATEFNFAVLLKGRRGNGKSILIAALVEPVPLALRCSLSPEHWGDATSVVGLNGKRLNFVTELNDGERIPGSSTKQVIGGESVMARNLYKDAFTMIPIAGHVFAANPWPGLQDKGPAQHDRWRVVRMEREIRGTTAEIPRAELLALLATEHDVIFSRCIRHATGIMAARRFVEPEFSIEAKADWRLQDDPLALFASERLRLRSTAGISVSACYEAYTNFCRKNGFAPLGRTKFAERLDTELGFGRKRGGSLKHFCADLLHDGG